MSDEEEIPGHILAWQEESWTFHGGTYHQDPMPIFTDYCVFHEGVHYPGMNCPHDEDGNDIGSLPYEPDDSATIFRNRIV